MRMKSVYLLFFIIIIPQFTLAQPKQNIQTNIEHSSFEKQQFMSYKDCFACIQGDVERAFKFGYGNMYLPHQNLNDYSNYQFASLFVTPSYFLEFEQKLATGFSINAKAEWQNLIIDTEERNIGLNNQIFYQFKSGGVDNYTLSIEPRWFINKKQAIKNGQSGNNLNGIYIGLNLSANWWNLGVFVPNQQDILSKASLFQLKGKTQYAVLNMGWQQRFIDNGFVSFKIGSGISHNTQNITSLPSPNGEQIPLPALKKWQGLLYYQVGVGSIIGKRSNLPEGTKDFWEYHEEEKEMWKVDFYNIFQGLNQKGGFGRAEIAYERKIKTSPFSVETGLQYHYRADWENNDFSGQLAFRLEPRYYFLLNRHIRQGRAANNLSSLYFSIVSEWYAGDTALTRNGQQQLFYDLTFGAQQRLFNNLFLDVKTGISLNERAENDGNIIYFDVRFGFVF